MRRGVVIAFAVLGLAACGGKEGGSSGAVDEPKPMAGAAEKTDVGAGAKAESPAPANQDASTCLDLVATGSYADAVPVCTSALQADAANEEVKNALATAKSKIAEMSGQAAGAASGAAAEAAGAASGAAQDAADKAKEAMPSKQE